MFLFLMSYCLQNLLYLFLYFESSSFPKPLSHKEEEKYFVKFFDGDLEARDKLISHNLRLVAHVAKKYYSSAQDQEDFISIGTIGLIKAINTFRLEKGRFSTYAARCIENEILMTLRTTKKLQNIVHLSDVLENDKDGNSLTRGDLISDTVKVDEVVEKKEEEEHLHTALAKVLTDREYEILRLRYGLGGKKALSQQIVSEQLGISRSYVSRLESKAIEKLRHKFKKD